jgi:hypothetical protein
LPAINKLELACFSAGFVQEMAERHPVNIRPQPGGNGTHEVGELGPMRDITEGELEEYREQDVSVFYISPVLLLCSPDNNLSGICPLPMSLDL